MQLLAAPCLPIKPFLAALPRQGVESPLSSNVDPAFIFDEQERWFPYWSEL
jgi:hypothetical protein